MLLKRLPDAVRDRMAGDIEEMDAVLGQFVAYARDGRDERRPGVSEDLRGRALVLHPTVSQHHRAVREHDRIHGIVGDEGCRGDARRLGYLHVREGRQRSA